MHTLGDASHKSSLPSTPSRLLRLPPELLEAVFAHCDAQSLARLSQCSTTCHRLVIDHGWPIHARQHFYSHSVTNRRRFSTRRILDYVRECSLVDESWERMENVSHEEIIAFPGRTMPVIRLQEDSQRLIVAGGSSLSTFVFPNNACAKPVEEVHVRPVSRRDSTGRLYNAWIGRSATDDITSIACIEGTGDFVLSHVSGLLQKCKIETGSGQRPYFRSLCRYGNTKRIIQSTSATKSGIIASVASHHGGIISLYRSASPWIDPITWRTKQKPWSLHLDPSASRPRWLALGDAGVTACHVYELNQDGSPVDRDRPVPLRGNSCSTAVYDFASPPPGSPLGEMGQIIVSGWYDSTVRIHDLRQASRLPALTLRDPFADVPVYSVACGGGAGYTIAAGTARHGLVRIWDVRQAREDIKSGSSIFGPGKDSSPVYSLQMEHDRLFGVTDRRAWMLGFGEQRNASLPPITKGWDGYDSPNNLMDNTVHRFSRTRIHSRDSNQLSYYRHSDMSLRKIT